MKELVKVRIKDSNEMENKINYLPNNFIAGDEKTPDRFNVYFGGVFGECFKGFFSRGAIVTGFTGDGCDWWHFMVESEGKWVEIHRDNISNSFYRIYEGDKDDISIENQFMSDGGMKAYKQIEAQEKERIKQKNIKKQAEIDAITEANRKKREERLKAKKDITYSIVKDLISDGSHESIKEMVEEASRLADEILTELEKHNN